jgi:hypothetical protein
MFNARHKGLTDDLLAQYLLEALLWTIVTHRHVGEAVFIELARVLLQLAAKIGLKFQQSHSSRICSIRLTA